MLEQLDLWRLRARDPGQELLQLGAQSVSLQFVRNDAARRYILRLAENGSARVTVPRRGSIKAAREFVHKHLAWLEKELQRRETQSVVPQAWTHGSEIFFRGEPTRLEIDRVAEAVRFADQLISIADANSNLRPRIERHLRKMATLELVPRTWALASVHQLAVSRVMVRNQRSRWGSCSTKRNICLNWRLIQTPAFVSDYLILHELMHLREMNHSPRFWRQVESVCPDYVKAEAWLKRNTRLLK